MIEMEQNNNKKNVNGFISLSRGIWILYILMIFSSALTVFSDLKVVDIREIAINNFMIFKHLFLLFVSPLLVAIGYFRFIKIENKNKFLYRLLIIYSCLSFIGLALLPIFGWGFNGANRWYSISVITFLTSDFCKIAFIFIGAYFTGKINILNEKISNLRNNKSQYSFDEYEEILYSLKKEKNYKYLLLYIISAIMILFIFISNISTALIYSIYLILFTFMARTPIYIWKRLIMFTSIFFILLGGLYYASSERIINIGRFNTVVSRLSELSRIDISEDDSIINNEKKDIISIKGNLYEPSKEEKISLSNDQLWGLGINRSKIKKILLKVDYIFAIAYEKIDVFAIIALIFILGAWSFLANKVGKNSPYSTWRYMAFGIGLFYPLQVSLNLLVVADIINTWQSIPVISLGVSSVISGSFAIALLLFINKLNNDKTENEFKEEQLDIDESNN